MLGRDLAYLNKATDSTDNNDEKNMMTGFQPYTVFNVTASSGNSSLEFNE